MYVIKASMFASTTVRSPEHESQRTHNGKSMVRRSWMRGPGFPGPGWIPIARTRRRNTVTTPEYRMPRPRNETKTWSPSTTPLRSKYRLRPAIAVGCRGTRRLFRNFVSRITNPSSVMSWKPEIQRLGNAQAADSQQREKRGEGPWPDRSSRRKFGCAHQQIMQLIGGEDEGPITDPSGREYSFREGTSCRLCPRHGQNEQTPGAC